MPPNNLVPFFLEHLFLWHTEYFISENLNDSSTFYKEYSAS